MSYKLAGIGRIEQVVETPGGSIRSLTVCAVLDGVPLDIRISTMSSDVDLRTAAVLDENVEVEVAR